MAKPPIPVTVLAGFLGAGKTTLLNHILSNANGLKMAVIVNDFGSINVDAELVKSQDNNMISLENGCICCSLAEGLVVAVMRLLALEQRPDHIIVETSGIADPLEVAQQFEDPELQQLAPLHAIITTVDAENVLALDEPMHTLAKKQVTVADIVLVNKTDLVAPAHLSAVDAWCLQQAPFAKLLHMQFGQIDLAIVFDLPLPTRTVSGSRCACGSAEHHHEHGHGQSVAHDFETFSYQTATPLSLERLYPVLQQFSVDAYRMKGILNLVDKPEHRCIFHCTGQRANITVDQPWQAGESKTTRLVFIAPKGRMDEHAMRKKLDALA